MIDWITVRVPDRHFTREEWCVLRDRGDRVQRYNPATGEVRWESQAWDSIRSDSHGLTFRIGSDAVWVQGSPARVIGDGCNVFGSGASAANDLLGCVDRMVSFFFQAVGLQRRGRIEEWIVSRVDVTGNLDLGGLEQVRQALRILRDLEGGRYRVSQQAGDTVYWSHRSRIRSGKAYAKGPHLRHLNKQRTHQGKEYSELEIEQANRLLRLELKLGSQWWRERSKPWYEMQPGDLWKQWESYFGRMIGEAELVDDMNLKERVMAAAPTEGQGRAAYGCWAMIESQGWERAREMYSKTTWYRNLKILRAAGLGDADFSAGRVVQLRRKIVEARLVHSWEELKAA